MSLLPVIHFGAFFSREILAARVNRSVHVFALLCLAAGLIPLWTDPVEGEAQTIGYFLLQICLWVIPLFSILIGVGSAQGEEEERDLLASQPVGSIGRILGKFMALGMVLAISAFLLVLPAAIAGAPLRHMATLWLYGTAGGCVFIALGLATGITIRDRIKAHLLGLSLWFLLLVGPDFLALAMARQGLAQDHPDLWLGLLMVSPLDAMRVGAILRLDRIPFDTTNGSNLTRWWLDHLEIWFALLAAGWSLLSLLWGGFWLRRRS